MTISLEEVLEHLFSHLEISVALWLLVIVAVLLDLWDGVYTAKVTHQRIHSHKLRVTVNKISEYWRLMLIGFLIDTAGCLFPVYALPYLSILFCLGLICVEAKSMFEHVRKRRSQAVDVAKLIQMLVECASEKDAKKLLKELSEYFGSNGKNLENKTVIK